MCYMQAHPYFWALGVFLWSSQLPDLTHAEVKKQFEKGHF